MTQAQPNPDLVEALRRSAAVIQELKSKLATYSEPIAIVGAACRFPGANSLEAYWKLLRDGMDTVTEVPPERWDVNAYYDSEPDTPGKTYVRHGGFLEQIDQFDPQFFNISPQEAKYIDPQQRLLLEVSWEALEHAGLPLEKVQGSRSGLFIGITTTDYLLIQRDLGVAHPMAYAGVGPSFAAGRLAYTLGIQGPTVVTDAACASSLVALHLACQSLRTGECDLALAGAVNVILLPDGVIGAAQALVFAPDGRCKTFDAAADGAIRSEGCGAIVLKRLSDARRAQDPILAVIHGTAMNHGGASSGITVPNKLAQEELLRAALRNGRIEPHEVAYIEAHGVGTPLGDPIEMRALAAVFDVPERTEPLWIGSSKTNIGHSETAAGMAGLLKVVLALQHDEIPPNLHFHAFNPYIDQEARVLRVPQTPIPWPHLGGSHKKIAGISAFGFNGANAHLLVGEAPTSATHEGTNNQAVGQQCPWHLLTLSAKSKPALLELAQRYCTLLAAHPQTDLGDLCYSAQVGRTHFEHRLSVATASTTMLQEQLVALATEALPAGVRMGRAPARQTKPPIAFLFPGFGGHYLNMGRELYETQPIVRQTLDRCAEIFYACMGQPLLPAIFSNDPATGAPKPKLERTPTATPAAAQPADLTPDQTLAQPVALFALEYALAALWQAWGIEPDILIGHSLGEYAAAAVASVFSLEDGMKLVIERTRLLHSLSLEATGTAIVMTSEAMLSDVLEAQKLPGSEAVAIAAVNAPNMLVISGPIAALQTITEVVRSQRIHAKVLNIPAAAHSPLLEPILDDFERFVRATHFSLPQTPLVSGMTGQLSSTEFTDPTYWRRQLRNPVRFAQGIATVFAQGVEIFLEVGPKPDLLVMARQNAEYWSRDAKPTGSLKEAVATDASRSLLRLPQAPLWLPTLRQGRSDWQQVVETLGELYAGGVAIDWGRYQQGCGRRKLVLPTYPFQRQRYWVEQSVQRQNGNGTTPYKQMGLSPRTNTLAAQDLSGFSNLTGSAVAYIQSCSEAERPALMLAYLQGVIASLLGLATSEAINPDAGLFEAGIDSLMALELRNRILGELGIKLASTDFLQNPTIAGLAQQLATQLPTAARLHTEASHRNNGACLSASAPLIAPTPLALLQSQGTKSPFFCVHPWAGVVYPYLELARALGTERPFYGIQAAGLYGEPDRSVEDMAARYIEAIHTVQPTGPYLLGGWSSGGVIAFEMAQQLRRAGQKVALLAILDAVSSAAMTDSLTFLLTGASRHLLPYVNLYLKLNSTPNAETSHLNGKDNAQVNGHHSISTKQFTLFKTLWQDFWTPADQPAMSKALYRVLTTSARAFSNYKLQPYPGEITLFRSQNQFTFWPQEETLGWRKVGQCRVITMPGHHFSMLQRPDVDVLAARLQDCLSTDDGG